MNIQSKIFFNWRCLNHLEKEGRKKMNILIELGCGVPGAIVCSLACGSICGPSGHGFPVCAVICGAICASMVITIFYFIGLYGMSTDCWGICRMI